MKTELDDNVVFRTHQEARAAIFSFLETFYNRRRLHSAIGYRSPAEREWIAATAAWVVTVSTFPGEGHSWHPLLTGTLQDR